MAGGRFYEERENIVTVINEQGRDLPPASSGGVIEAYTPPADDLPFIGPLSVDEAIERQRAIVAQGTRSTLPLMHKLADGQVLLVTAVTPGAAPTPQAQGRFGRCQPYLLAGAAVLLAAVVAVLLFLFFVGLKALVVWGMANAVTIGAGLAFVAVTALVFLFALARARHGHPVRRY